MTNDATTEAAIDRAGAFLRQQIGLRAEGTLRGRLLRSLVDEAAARREALDVYVERICHGGEGLEHLVNRLTVQESGFFRHPEHFDVLTNAILPGLDRPVRIWSAACGNGQEAYSLAMLLEEQGVSGMVAASDLSTAALARTDEAWYSAREISGVSPLRRRLHLVNDDGGARIGPRVQARVTTLQHNLVADLPSHVGSCQVVFCRNVLIYLSAEHASSFLDRLADALAPGAYVFLGAAESLWQVSDRFQPVRLGGAFVYRRLAQQPRPAAVMEAGSPRPARKSTARSLARSTGRSAAATRAHGEADLAETATLAEIGRSALAAGDHATAIVTFRKWTYLTPDNPMGPFHLGLALEAGGHLMSAQRAFAVARAVLVGTGSAPVEADLEGFAREELLKLLDAKQVLDR